MPIGGGLPMSVSALERIPSPGRQPHPRERRLPPKNAGLGIAYLDAAGFKSFLEQQEEKDVPAAMKAAGIDI